MIIVGYKGIGKSTLAKADSNVIDLDSTCFDFYNKDGVYGKPEIWVPFYCQMAEHLSEQGHVVFVSSQPEVREYLGLHCNEPVYAIFPDRSLKDEWIDKMFQEHRESYPYNEQKAYEEEVSSFDRNIRDMEWEGHPACRYFKDYEVIKDNYEVIKDMNYSLAKMVDVLKEREVEKQNRKRGVNSDCYLVTVSETLSHTYKIRKDSAPTKEDAERIAQDLYDEGSIILDRSDFDGTEEIEARSVVSNETEFFDFYDDLEDYINKDVDMDL